MNIWITFMSEPNVGAMKPLLSSEMINGSITTTLLSSFINSSNNFTKQLMTVILMSSIDEIKKMSTDIFTYIRSNFKSILQFINPLCLLRAIIRTIKNMFVKVFYRRRECVNNEITPYVKPDKEIKMAIQPSFLGNIINHIRQNQQTSELIYDENYSIDVKNRNDILLDKNKYLKNQ